MAITVDQTSLGTGNASGAASVSMTTTAAVASGGMIAFVVGMFRNAVITVTATMAGTSMTAAHNLRSGSLHIWLFYGFPSGGLASGSTLQATFTGNTADTICGAASYAGVDTTGTVTAFNAAAAATAAWGSGNVAGNSGDALIGGMFTDGGASSSTPGGTAVERIDRNVAGQSETLVLEDILSIGGTTALAGTLDTAASNIAVAAAFKPVAGGGGGGVTVKNLAALGVG